MKRIVAAGIIVVLNMVYVAPSFALPYGAGCYGSNIFNKSHVVGDVDLNGVVNVFDLVKMLGKFGTNGRQDCINVPDVDVNGIVNVFDLVKLLSRFGQTG